MNPHEKARTAILEAAHEIVRDLFETGLVDAETMRRFDASCLSEELEHSDQP